MIFKGIFHLVFALSLLQPATPDTLIYTVSLLNLNIGKASFLESRGPGDQVTLEITARTNFLGSLVYKVRNYYKMAINPRGSRGWQLETRASEKSVHDTTFFEFRPNENIVNYNNSVAISVPPGTQNFFSALIGLREMAKSNLNYASIPIIANGRIWLAETRLEKHGEIDIGDCSKPCKIITVSFKPVDRWGTGFKSRPDILTKELVHRKTRLRIWIADDPPYKFLKMSFKRSPLAVNLTITNPDG